jgi:hypothetical protein
VPARTSAAELRGRAEWSRRPERELVVVLLAAGAALVAATDAPAVTGSANVDRVWAATYAVGLTIGASRSRRWTWLGLGAAAALGTGGAVGVAAGFVALAAAVAGTARARAIGRIGALVGASAAVALLRWDAGPPWVAATAATAAAVIVLPALGVTQGRRRLPPWLLSAAAFTAVGMIAWSGAEAIETRTRLDLAAGRLDGAVAAAADGRAGDAAQRFELAAQAFGGARAAARSPALWPLRFVPVIGPHIRVAETAGDAGREVSSAAATAARGADVDVLRLVDGGLDLDVVAAMHPLLADLASRLASSLDAVGNADNPWLLPSVGHRLDQVTSRLRTLAHGADLGASATEVLPDLLGGHGSRTYLVGFTTPAEARGLGGFLANYAEIEADEGQLRLVRTGPISDLSDALPPDPSLRGLDEYRSRYGRLRPARFPGNVTASPSFPLVADALAQIYPQTPGGRAVDGVFIVDPEGLAGILAVTGPVTVVGLDHPLAADEAAEFLLRGQYDLAVGVDQADRKALLDDIVRATFEALTHATLPGPRTLGDTFGPLVAAGRVRGTTSSPAAAPLFAELGLDAAFPDPAGGDLLSVVTGNRGQNKLDAYLHRAVAYDVTYDPASGETHAVVEVRLRNEPPDGELPYEVGYNPFGLPLGTNATRLDVYSPLALDEVTVDGNPAPVAETRELGLLVHGVVLDVPRDGVAVVRFSLSGALRPGDRYRLVLVPQPLANPDDVTVRIQAPDGWRPTSATEPLVADDRAATGSPLPNETSRLAATFGD